MIGIVDYGMGNLLSVYNAFDYLGADVKICKFPEDLANVERIVIPGVGAFQDCIEKLKTTGFTEALQENVINLAKPTLGICLGMQVMAMRSFENGEHAGLGWFDAEVVKLKPSEASVRVPNIGWNEVEYALNITIFDKLPQKADFYFVHSYHVQCNSMVDIAATYQNAQQVTAAIIKDNIFATQFHPEKSQDHGLTLLDNFIKWMP